MKYIFILKYTHGIHKVDSKRILILEKNVAEINTNIRNLDQRFGKVENSIASIEKSVRCRLWGGVIPVHGSKGNR